MNIFVLNTGRCGSTTFIKACSHIENYSSGHESRAMHIGTSRLDFPDNHIEADNRLSWVLGRLNRQFGQDAFYVHLQRDDAATARSFANRFGSGIIDAYRKEILIDLDPDTDPFDVATDYCDTVTSNILFFLRDKPNQMNFDLENAAEDYPKFWARISAVGNLDAALDEFQIAYNPSNFETTKSSSLFSTVFPRKIKKGIKRLIGR